MFGLYARLAVAAAIALALAGTHWKAYTKGRDVVRAEWALDAAERTQAALAASEAARARESELQTKVGRVDRAYQESKRATQHVARAAADGLRNLEAILAAPATASSSAVASSGNHGTGGLERELLAICAADFARMGQEAQRLQGKTIALQDYINAIRANP